MISKVTKITTVDTLYIHIPTKVVKEKKIKRGDVIKWEIKDIIRDD